MSRGAGPQLCESVAAASRFGAPSRTTVRVAGAQVARSRGAASSKAEAAKKAVGAAGGIDVVIVTALKEEYDEARKVDEGALSDWRVDDVEGVEVAFRSYGRREGPPLQIALSWATRMRATSTADVAGRLVDKLRARCVAMSGVCAGRRGKVEPGDVIIGSLLYTYDAGATRVEIDDDGTQRKRFQAEPNPYPLEDLWLRRAQTFQMPLGASWLAARPLTLRAQCDWVLERMKENKDPLEEADQASRCPAWPAVLERLRAMKYVTSRGPLALTKIGRAYIEELLTVNARRLPEAPAWRWHVAPIATGNDVMRDPQIFDRLSQSMRTVLGLEMEAAAIAAIAHSRRLPWLVMKGVMDHADHDKDDQLKPFAARASAECLVAFLRENLPPPPTGRPRASRRRPAEPSSGSESPGSGPGAEREAGDSKEDEHLSRYLAKVEREIAQKLQSMPVAAAALAKELEVEASAQAHGAKLARVVVHEKTGRQLVKALNDADESLRESGASLVDRRLLKKMMLEVLPLASDWRSWVQKGRAALASDRASFVDLPLATDTMAEAILAGVELQPCRYERDTATGPVGRAIVRMPAAGGAYIGRLAEATVGHLACQLLDLSPEAPELRDHAAMRRRVDEALQFYCEVKGDDHLPRWLLVDDALLSHVGRSDGGEGDALVAKAVADLSGELPHLRILRKGAGIPGETYLALNVGTLWRKPL